MKRKRHYQPMPAVQNIVVVLAYSEAREVVLVECRHHAIKQWQFPGGIPSHRESLIETACRKTRRDLCLEVLSGRFEQVRTIKKEFEGRTQIFSFYRMYLTRGEREGLPEKNRNGLAVRPSFITDMRSLLSPEDFDLVN